MTKPHFLVVAGRLVHVDRVRETPLEAARRRYGRPFGTVWQKWEGPRFWTAERVGQLSVDNQAHREDREARLKRGEVIQLVKVAE